ncbi:MAG: hypothetical protein KAT32_01005 [Candidatus Moranbacteria bacterium]|nr:hypothetical protein [Candidatus Moranbacteria bacterium]
MKKSTKKLKKIPVKEVVNKVSVELAEIITVKNDLEFSKTSCQIILLNSHDGQYETVDIALWNSAIISFFRCFGGGKRGYKLDKKIFENLPGEPMNFYDFLKNLRDKHLAHPVNIFEEVKIGVIFSDDYKELLGISNFFIKRLLETPETIKQFIGFINVALKEVNFELEIKNIQLVNVVKKESAINISKWENLKYVVPDSLKASEKNRVGSKEPRFKK